MRFVNCTPCQGHRKMFLGLCQMVLMTSKTSLQKWSGVFLFPSVSPVFFQIGTVTYQHRLRFRWRGFMYEFLSLIRKARTRCDLTGFHLAARSAQVLSLGRLACWRSSRPGARGLSARFNTLFLSRTPRLCPVAVDITMLTRRKLRLEEVYSERLFPASASDQRNAFPEVIKIPESKATALQTLDSAVYSFNRTVGEIILDAVKNSCTMWKRSMMIRAFGNNSLMNLMYWAFRSTTTDFTAALSRFV
ncbi:hypothetical protein LRU_00709 [Ligilactobacillus ruminis SPM0211]|uniref:Uncharacterized protein n=1 Tax=Ligilactobacillus ruminis SPM0211 TaxID=1040964 RepID=F7QZ67_9LACO|nr:hypothetical protein LRU_00709 [Ligilactobacillus ruminis SPM0211]